MKGLSFSGYHGLLPGERDKPQPFIIDLVLYIDLLEAGQRDDIAFSVDYSLIYQEVRQVVEGNPYNLIEALAEEISCRLLGLFPRIAALKTTVSKPQAPIEGKFDNVAVEIYRSRGPRE